MKKLLYILLLLSAAACDKPLEEEVYSSFGPNNFFKTADDAEALLNAAYALEQKQGTDGFRNILVMAEVTTDLLIIREGGLRGLAQPLEDFTWNASHEFFDVAWTRYYSAIYRANLVIDNVPNIDFDEERKRQIIAEARFLRASGYISLYDLFGPTPLITNSISSSEDRPARATREEFVKFVTDELNAVADILPVTARQYGRATKGAALAFLTKFYLNNKDWQKTNETAQKVIDLNVYSLFDSANRTDLFKLANEKNSEFIYVRPHVAQPGLGTNYLPHAAPPEL
ncbi:RagB/SusD family nutrient uptake outer membrane protein [Dyadobacter sp. 676]|uniref:RagB/SusD family nutrient uptake outer membrane protein n=1 Tax=Dyadobacter sp. 676 TaxID=3088362 RepID=A0AAU8FIK5_9BACT